MKDRREYIRRALCILQVFVLITALTACSQSSDSQNRRAGNGDTGNTLVYGSGDYTRINPAMDEHGENP